MNRTEFSSITFKGQQFNYTDRELMLPKAAVGKLIGILERWQRVFPYEPTLAETAYGVPSLMVRFDGVLDERGEFQIYEIQDGCGWIGYAGIANHAFRKRRDHLRDSVWPPIKLLLDERNEYKDRRRELLFADFSSTIGSHRAVHILNQDAGQDAEAFTFQTSPDNEHDDPLWLPQISLDEAFCSDDALMFRWPVGKKERTRFAPLLRRSVKPVFTHQDKRYGVEFGYWETVYWHPSERGDRLPWNESFALKPLKGYGSRDVVIWKNGDRKGCATRNQVLRALETNQQMYLQKFIEPMRIDIDGAPYNAILRPFFGFDTTERRWLPLHGVWAARPYPNLRIHGSSDAVTGPLMMED